MKKRVELVVKDAYDLPEYKTPGSAGLDLYANNADAVMLKPGDRAIITTGLFMAIPEGMEAQVRPRSGLVLKHGITVMNSPGTIDSDYRGEIMVILYNGGDRNFFVNQGDRVAQLVFAKYEQVTFKEVSELSDTKRGTGGFGHTGK